MSSLPSIAMTLREALASIRDVEGSGRPAEFEIVVGDNGLKEETRRLCSNTARSTSPPGRRRLLRAQRGNGAASGDFIAFRTTTTCLVAWAHRAASGLSGRASQPRRRLRSGHLHRSSSTRSAPLAGGPGQRGRPAAPHAQRPFSRRSALVARRSDRQHRYFDTRLIGGRTGLAAAPRHEEQARLRVDALHPVSQPCAGDL